MENRSHALATGAFIVLLGAALVAVIAWFQGDHGERVGYTVVSRTGVPGLNLRAPVKLQGVEVGKVEAISFDPQDPRQILVSIEVLKTAPLNPQTAARLGYQGITGLSFIDLFEDPQQKPEAGAPQRIALRPSLLDQLSSDGPRVLTGINDAAQRVGELLGEGNQRQLMQTLGQVDAAARQIAVLAGQLQPGAQALPPLLAHADALVRGAGVSLQRIDGVAGESALLVQELRQRSQALDKLGLAAQQLQQTTQRLELALVGADRPRAQPLVDELGQAARAVDRAAADVGEQPQSLLFGRATAPPGPGEAGFDANGKGR
ncbi:MAG: MlaD family protein [Burkholderiaceae bacterium]